MAEQSQTSVIKNLSLSDSLFSRTGWSWLWLVARLYVGYTWITAGLEKLENPGWVETRASLKGFWERAVAMPDAPGRPLIAFDWYRVFLQSLLDSGVYT